MLVRLFVNSLYVVRSITMITEVPKEVFHSTINLNAAYRVAGYEDRQTNLFNQ